MLRSPKIFRISEQFWENFLNSERILTEFWCAKIRMIRSLGDRIFEPWSQGCFSAEISRASSADSSRWTTPARHRVERFGCRATVSFECFGSELCSNSVRIQEHFSEFFRNSENFRNSQHFLEYSAKFREIFIRLSVKFDENHWKTMIFQNFEQKMWNC